MLSIESSLRHPRRGFIKLEDTVAVTADGCELFADRYRFWLQTGERARAAA